MRFRLRPHAVFKLLRHRRKPSPNLWKFGLDVGDVIAARTMLAMAGKLSPAEAHRMVEEKRLSVRSSRPPRRSSADEADRRRTITSKCIGAR
jgi:hypothetical protein